MVSLEGLPPLFSCYSGNLSLVYRTALGGTASFISTDNSRRHVSLDEGRRLAFLYHRSVKDRLGEKR